ncbi:hypothetical protein Droror1_Dr00014340 [Drosera rotundifolia]
MENMSGEKGRTGLVVILRNLGFLGLNRQNGSLVLGEERRFVESTERGFSFLKSFSQPTTVQPEKKWEAAAGARGGGGGVGRGWERRRRCFLRERAGVLRMGIRDAVKMKGICR